MIQSIKYIISIVVIIATAFNTASGQKIMTLEECRKQAVEYNKELKIAALQKEETVAYQKAARTAYLPSLSSDISLMHRPSEVEVSIPGYFLPTAESAEAAQAGDFSGESNVWSPGFGLAINNLTLIQSGISLAQPIYTGGKIKYSNQQSDLGVEITDLAFNLKHDEVIEKTDEAFWNLAMVASNIELVEKYIEMLTELEEQMAAMHEVGLQPVSEKLKVSVQKNEAELNLMKAENGLKLAKMYLNQILGQDLETDFQIQYDENLEINRINLATGIQSAGINRNELKILEKQKELSVLDAKIAKADYLPQAGFSVQYTNFWVKDLNEQIDFQPMIGAQVSIPIFSWGQGKHKQRAAQLKVQQSQTKLQNTSELINLEVMQVRVQLEEAFESIKLAQKNIIEANESLEETKASFEVGLNTTTEMLNAQANWQKANAQLIQANAQYKVLETKWAKVTGQLN